ncbi:MAG: (S)-ureidoglycine aminohydrolase [Bryobacterales bacterium]|nr:(S)-ureidoglycine aminohydrolase [Bryobacterales bacterium]MBV9401327.1 (S)-ureidoglycine aminohydrolase [Bryobacterales bacterium]
MHELGVTRSARRQDHLLQTPDTFVRAPLPGMTGATAVIHAAPQIGAKFMQYTAEFERGGMLPAAAMQRFLYVLEGELECGEQTLLRAGDYAYFPAGSKKCLATRERARAAVIEKPFQTLDGKPAPKFFTGRENEIKPETFMGDQDLEVRALVPADPCFDFAVNTMTYQPGAALPMVEIHVMEHGLLMLEGGGIYRLNDCWYPVSAGDFIWMAPFCPQWFGAIGKRPAKYLIYKDWNRDPAA